MLQMTAAAGHHLQEGRLYKAFRLLEQVRAGLPAATAPADKGAALCAPPRFRFGLGFHPSPPPGHSTDQTYLWLLLAMSSQSRRCRCMCT